MPQDFEALYSEYFPKVRGLYRKLGVADSEIDELTQDALLRVYQSIEKGKTVSGGFVFTVARNLFFNHLERQKDPSKRLHATTVDAGEVHHPAPGPEREAVQKDELRHFRAAFDQLPQRQQQCLLLQVVEGCSYREIATLIGIGVESVRSHLRVGREKLRQRLDRGTVT